MRVKPTMKTLKEIDSEGYALVRIRSRDLSSRHRFCEWRYCVWDRLMYR
jgi:hypothetical protein